MLWNGRQFTVTRRVSLVEQELFIYFLGMLNHLDSLEENMAIMIVEIQNSRDFTNDKLKSRNIPTTTNMARNFVSYAVRYNNTLIDWKQQD